MRASDERIIGFFSNSPIRCFPAMLDALNYLDGQKIPEEIECELFDEALGDNDELKVKIRVPDIKGITANALHQYTKHLRECHLIRRRKHTTRNVPGEPEEVVVFYELTPAGKEMIRILEAIDGARGSK